MTALVDTATRTGQGRRLHARRLSIALLAACALWLLIDHFALAPSWLLWTAAPMAVVTALAVFVAGHVGWERTVSAAQAAGLVARDDEFD